ncbi:Nicotinamide-nucleotide adenylyltransferase [Pseudomonas fluorescens]|uniref:Nicotinamide-nucleotide adenylyltransferase n=1 Tax=Pseudomonas fluorescens TaxID=294 RepID=A0A5E7KGN4_PSEFL|nr:Nicotinamide-nucleotide adenylyltransferase [Pseudomonas fluorescens]
MFDFGRRLVKVAKTSGPLWGALMICMFFVAVASYYFKISDLPAYWVSAFLFFSGVILSFIFARSAGLDGALSHFREVIIGSTSIGLISIKKLSENPPETIALQTKISMQFMGIAGEKFLKVALETGIFFRSNSNSQAVRIMLMDPFSDDMSRLSMGKDSPSTNRARIISTIKLLHDLQLKGYKFEVRLYPKTPPLRLLISDNTVTAMSVYSPGTDGWRNAQLIFDAKNCPDSLAPYFFELFNDLWERGLNFNLSQRSMALASFEKKGPDSSQVKIGMVHGRFQPFHHEHFEYVLYGVSKSEKCVIGITQPNIGSITDCELLPHRGTVEGNPYSFEERADMIKLSLLEWGVKEDRFEIIPFDVDKPEESIGKLRSEYGGVVQFMRLFSDWELHKKKLFEDSGMEVKIVRSESSQYSTKNVTGTLVRELIASDRNWRDFVPVGTKSVISSKVKSTRK